VYAFEKAFRSGAEPRIEDFLPPDGPDRLPLLAELVHSDLELRLRAGWPARLGEYLARYPELADRPDSLAGILETELRDRPPLGESPSLAAYEWSYPSLGRRLREVFPQVGGSAP